MNARERTGGAFRQGIWIAVAAMLSAVVPVPGKTVGEIFRKVMAEGDSLEQVVQSLHKLVLSTSANLSYDNSGGGFANLTYRNQLHSALGAIGAAIGKQPTGYRPASLANVSAGGMVSAAGQNDAEGLAWRYALLECNAFAFAGDEAPYESKHALRCSVMANEFSRRAVT